MEDAGRWAQLDAFLPPAVRAELEERFWRPIETKATLERLRDDPAFYADPGRHPAIFADHGVVHVRDVAGGLVHLVEALDGLLLPARPPERRRFLAAYGVAITYLHDVGMIDMSRVGRRVHPQYGAHAAYWDASHALVAHVLAAGPVRERLDAVAAEEPFAAPLDIVVRELLSLTAAHSKTTIPAALLDDRKALRRAMREIVFTSLEAHRASVGGSTASPPEQPEAVDIASLYPDRDAAYAWLEAADGAQAILADDIIDTIRTLRAADVLRQRGTVLRTSGGYEICFDARTALAVCTLRTASGDAAYVITYTDPRGAGEANLRMAYITARGHLRIGFHRGAFPSAAVAQRAAESVAHAILDIQADVLPSFDGRPARGLPPPSHPAGAIRIQLEQPADDPSFADAVAAVLASHDPSLTPRLEAVADLEDADPTERARFFRGEPIEPGSELADEITRNLRSHGVETSALDRESAFREVTRATVRAGEVLVAAGSSPSFVYVPMGPGLVVQPEGGYAPSPLSPWVPVGTTGVIRRSERNSRIIAWREVDVVMIPGERYARDWLRPLSPDELRERLEPVPAT